MNAKKKNYVKKQQTTDQEKATIRKTISMQEQLKLFANIVVDIYFENLSNYTNEKK